MAYHLQVKFGELKGTNRRCTVCLKPATRMLENSQDGSVSRSICDQEKCLRIAVLR